MCASILEDDKSAQRNTIQKQISEILSDYELAPPEGMNSAHVGRWVGQFEVRDQLFILEQTLALLRNAYISRNDYVKKIDDILNSEKNRHIFSRAAFLKIQEANRGTSQSDLLELIQTQAETFGELNIATISRFSTSRRVSQFDEFIYFDDICFSGNKALKDIIWFAEHFNLRDVTIRVFFLGTHRYATYMLKKNLRKGLKAVTLHLL